MMNLDQYNRQLKPCFQCKTQSAEIERNKYAVGVMCDCGTQFIFEDPKTPLVNQSHLRYLCAKNYVLLRS